MTPRFKRSLVMPFINTLRSERRARFHRHYLHLTATGKTGSARMTLPGLRMGGQEPWGPSAAWPEVTRKCHTQAEVQVFSLLVQCAFHFSSGSPSVVQGTLGWGLSLRPFLGVNFHNQVRLICLFHLHSLMSVQWSFPETP